MKKAIVVFCGVLLCALGMLAVGAGLHGRRGGHEREGDILIAASDSSANVRASADYVCDGTADEVQINAAIDALFAERTGTGIGGTVRLAPGTYTLAATIGLPYQISLQGAGVYATTLKLGADANCPAITLEGTASKGFNRIADLYIDCDVTDAMNDTYGIYEDSIQTLDVRLDNVMIFYAAKDGIHLTNGAWGHCYNSLIVEYCDGNGLAIDANSAPKLLNCKFMENGETAGHSVYYGGTSTFHVANCEFHTADSTTPSYALYSYGPLYMTTSKITEARDIDGGNTEYSYGVFVRGAMSSLANCYFYGGERFLHLHSASDRTTVTGCQFYSLDPNSGDPNTIGAYVYNQDMRFVGCSFYNCAEAIKWYSSATSTRVIGCSFDNNAIAISLAGTGHTFSDNLFTGNTTDWSGTPSATDTYGAGNSHPNVQVQSAATGVTARYDGHCLTATYTLTGENSVDMADDANDHGVGVKIADLADGTYMVQGAYLEIASSDTTGLATGGAEVYKVAIGLSEASDDDDLTDEDDFLGEAEMDTEDASSGPAVPSNTTAAVVTASSKGVWLNFGATDATITGAASIEVTGTLRVFLHRVK